MNERQRTVLGVAVMALIVAGLFFVPWRVGDSGKIEWAPAYRQPVSHSKSYSTTRPGARYVYEEAEVAVGVFVLELLAIGTIGGTVFVLSRGRRRRK